MTDEELLAEISQDHGPETAELVAEILAGTRGEPVGRHSTRAGDRNTRAGVPSRQGSVFDCVRGVRHLSHDPGGHVQSSTGPNTGR